MISFRVFGDPAPQGSKTIMRGRLVESSKKLPAWRKAVTEAAEQVDFYTEDAVDVLIIFYMPKPKSKAKAPISKTRHRQTNSLGRRLPVWDCHQG